MSLGNFRHGRTAMALLLPILGSCGGDNLYMDGLGPSDRSRPAIMFVEPERDQRIAIGDSVLVRLDLSDDTGIDSVVISGYALRGSETLGTQAQVPRFETRTIQFGPPAIQPRDTIIARFLLPTSDIVPEDSAYLEARAVDAAGNEHRDIIRIRLGGPRVSIDSPGTGTMIRAGSEIKLGISASDPLDHILSLRLIGSGAIAVDTMLLLDPPRAAVDTVIALALSEDAGVGEVSLRATARSTSNESTTSRPVALRLQPRAEDIQPPRVRYSAVLAEWSEAYDSVTVTVVATDDVRTQRVGVTMLPIIRLPSRTDTLRIHSITEPRDSATFRISLAHLGIPAPVDTSTLRLEITAFAYDTADNCATSTLPGSARSERCIGTDPVQGIRSGARFETVLVRGRTIPFAGRADVIADLATDGRHLILSNITRNRLEVLPIGGAEFGGAVAVGSRPWGLALDPRNDRLYVANSGGTNISVVSTHSWTEIDRIQTPNVKLYNVGFSARTVEDTQTGDSISALFPTSVTRHDYSDRPQFIGISRHGKILYSTLPTRAAGDGTVRIHDLAQDRLEIVTEYAEERIDSRVVIVNADSAFLVAASPNNLLQVCPRDRSTNSALDRKLGVKCFLGSVGEVERSIMVAGYDTRFLYNLDISEIGLGDTTFVAVSGDHTTIAFGEGGRENARIMAFVDRPGTDGPLAKYGEIRDLVGNTAERIIALALNRDGSLGLARGGESYFFSRELRLQGEVDTESGGGGVDMHPDNPTVRRAFVSGVQEDGLSFIDIVDTFHFGRVTRIFLRDPVTGPLRAVRAADGSLKIYAVTRGGLVALDVYANDL